MPHRIASAWRRYQKRLDGEAGASLNGRLGEFLKTFLFRHSQADGLRSAWREYGHSEELISEIKSSDRRENSKRPAYRVVAGEPGRRRGLALGLAPPVRKQRK